MKCVRIIALSCTISILALCLNTQNVFASFTDLSANGKNAKAVEFLLEKQIVKGYPDGTFKPDINVNRAELLKILVLGLGFGEPDGKYHDCFNDVKGEWFAPYICFAKERSWIKGYSDGNFRPAQSVNNAEAIKMLLQVSGEELATTGGGEWYEVYMHTAKENGVIDSSGYEPGNFMNRGSMSESLFRTIVKRSLNAKKYEESLLDNLDSAKKNYDTTIAELQKRIQELEKRLDSVQTELHDANGKLLSISSKAGVTTFAAPVYEMSSQSVDIPVTTVIADNSKQEVRFENSSSTNTTLATSSGVTVTIPNDTQMYLPADASSSFQLMKLDSNYPKPPAGVTFETVAKVGFDSLSHVQVPGGIRISLPGFHKRVYRTSGTDGWTIDDGPCDSATPPQLKGSQKMCIYHIGMSDTQILTRELSIFAGGNDPERFTVTPQGNYEDSETGLVWYASDLNYQVWSTDDTASASSISCAGQNFRLPTALELYSVLSSDPKPGTNIYSLLPGLKESSYWTSTIFKSYDPEETNDHLMNYSKSVWVIDVTSGLKHTNKKSMILPVRCVLDTEEVYVPANPQYTNEGGNYRDNQTDLLWYATDAASSKWYEAEAVCAAVNGDWRLPTRLELETLIRPKNTLPHSDLSGLDNDGLDDWYWSSTLAIGTANQKAWGVNLYTGIVATIPISETFKIRCIEE